MVAQRVDVGELGEEAALAVVEGGEELLEASEVGGGEVRDKILEAAIAVRVDARDGREVVGVEGYEGELKGVRARREGGQVGGGGHWLGICRHSGMDEMGGRRGEDACKQEEEGDEKGDERAEAIEDAGGGPGSGREQRGMRRA